MNPKGLSKAILSYYNHFTGSKLDSVKDIPASSMRVMLMYEAKILYRPEILRLLNKGLSWNDVCRILGVKYRTVRYVAENIFNKAQRQSG